MLPLTVQTLSIPVNKQMSRFTNYSCYPQPSKNLQKVFRTPQYGKLVSLKLPPICSDSNTKL